MKGLFAIAAVLSVALAACENNGGSTVVGSGSDTQINGVTFTIDTTYLDGSGSGKLVAAGLVTSANTRIVAPWYVECQFYTDSTMKIKLGGNDTQIPVPLSQGQSTFWKITFYTSTVNVKKYPDFAVGNPRAIYKN